MLALRDKEKIKVVPRNSALWPPFYFYGGSLMENKGKYYITTAIAYASGKPHIGNTYEIIMADSTRLNSSHSV